MQNKTHLLWRYNVEVLINAHLQGMYCEHLCEIITVKGGDKRKHIINKIHIFAFKTLRNLDQYIYCFYLFIHIVVFFIEDIGCWIYTWIVINWKSLPSKGNIHIGLL